MIRRLYVHNFRCLENFELKLAGQSSVLLIGKNGSGKTTVGLALELLQKIARGINRVGALIRAGDFSSGRSDVPMRFEIEAELAGRVFEYGIAFELPEGFNELRILDEKLVVDGEPVYSREHAQVNLRGSARSKESAFSIDWHLVALPIIQEKSQADPLFVWKQSFARMLILRPIPALMRGDSDRKTLEPDLQLTGFAAWLSGLLAYQPAAYLKIDGYLKQLMPDLKEIRNPPTGRASQSIEVHFASSAGNVGIPLEDLSDGEKCFLICAVVLAANEAYGPLICFWDEPDNYLALDEVGHFVLDLRRGFQSGGQFLATSHNPEAIRRFSHENTIYLHRRNHLEPTIVRPLDELEVKGDLIGALIRGDVEP